MIGVTMTKVNSFVWTQVIYQLDNLTSNIES